MNCKKIVPAAAAIGGIAGAVLRAGNLLTGYEPETGLPVPGNMAQTLLIALSVVMVVGLFWLSSHFREDRGAVFEDVFSGVDTGVKLVAVVTGLAMIAAGVGGLASLFPQMSHAAGREMFALLPLIPQWLLAIATGICLIGLTAALGRRVVTETTAVMTIVPMFWSGFDLIVEFKNNGESPFVGQYAFELFAAICLTYAFYALAGFLYSQSSPFRFAFSAGLSVFFCLITVGGGVISILLGGERLTMDTALRYLCFLAAGIWLLVMLILCARNLSSQGEKTAASR